MTMVGNAFSGVVVVALAGCLTACAGQSQPSQTPSSSPPVGSSSDASTSTDIAATPTPQGLFSVDTGRRLALICLGHGTPVVVFDAGSLDAGIARWENSAVFDMVAEHTTVCAYDRAGLGGSDVAPNRPRVLNDVAKDLHALLASAHIKRPVVMVGASGGGFDVYQHAGRYPDDVAGLVMLDVPPGQPSMSHSDGPPAWSSAENPEHVDYYAEEHQMAVARLPIHAIPVTVVTAAGGQSAHPAEQRVWLKGSSRPVQVVLEGGHEIAVDDPDGVTTQILGVLAAVSRGS